MGDRMENETAVITAPPFERAQADFMGAVMDPDRPSPDRFLARLDVNLDDVRRQLSWMLGCDVTVTPVPGPSFQEAVERLYGTDLVGGAVRGELMHELAERLHGLPSTQQTQASDDHIVIRVVDDLLTQAVTMDASDVHLEPGRSGLVVRFRVDGSLRVVSQLPSAAQPALTARLKVMADLDVAERRTPQDGRFRFDASRPPVDVRMSTLPALHGETVVLRLLKTNAAIPELEALGFGDDNLVRFLEVLSRPHGLLLITGPTGSGKSLTTFSALKRRATSAINACTLEDPVEYELPGLNQTQVNRKTGLDFASGLRALLRQDPDVLMIGEIRDRETAQMAVRAAMTGHLVIATLHTNDAVTAVSRLLDMGVEAIDLSAALSGVLAQRLVRVRCQACRGNGCQACHGLGLKGRMALHEFLHADRDFRAGIQHRYGVDALRDLAEKSGMRTLLDDGLAKVEAGLTTFAEVRAQAA